MRIVHLDACYEFPFDTTRARAGVLPHLCRAEHRRQLLASTGEFTDRALKRYDDTAISSSATFAENGYDSAVGWATIRGMTRSTAVVL